MKTPIDKQLTLTLYSHPMNDLTMRWKAWIVFPPGSTDDTYASVMMVDGEGKDIPSATFEFAGAHIAIQEGKGALRCADFVAGKHESAIWVYRPGMAPVPGALTFE